MADNSQLTDKEIKKLRSLVQLLGKDIDKVDFDNLIKSGGAARDYLNKLEAEAEEFTSDIGYSITAFQRLVGELKNTYSGVNNVTKSYKGLISLAQDLQLHQQNITKLDEKGVEKLRERLETQQLEFKNADALLKLEEQSLEGQLKKAKREKEEVERQADLLSDLQTRRTLTEAEEKTYDKLVKQYAQIEKSEKELGKLLTQNRVTQSEISGVIEEQDAHYNSIKAAIDIIDSQLEKQNKLLGLGGVAVASLSTALNNLGFEGLASKLGIDDAKEKMASLAEKIVKDQKAQLVLQEQINKAKENLPTGRYDNLLKKLEREKQLEKEIIEIRNKGGDEKALKAKEKALESIKAGYTEEEKTLGQNINNLDVLTKSNAQYTGINGKIAVLTEGIKSMGSSLIKNLTDPISLTVLFTGKLIGALKASDQAAGNLAKQFGKSYEQASNTRQELNVLANSTGNVNVTTQALQESVMEVGKALGTNAKLNDADLITMTELTKQAGYTYDELMGIEKLSLANNKTLDQNVKEIQGAARAYNAKNKLAINEKDVLKEVNKASASLKLSLGGSVTALTDAVMKTKQFGLSLDQAEKMSSSLLDFESSISAEMEAEMLTGKSLNLEKARSLALQGKTADAAAEIARQVGSAAQFGEMNVIQQEAIAKAAGLSRDELANSLIEKEALAKLNDKESKSLQEAYNKMKARGMTEAQIQAELGEQVNTQQLESQSLQDKYQATTQKVMDIFISMADPLLEIINIVRPIFGLFGKIAGYLGQAINKVTTFGKYLGEISNGWIPKILGGVVAIGVALGVTGLAASKLGSIFGAMMSPIKALGKGIASLIPKNMGGVLGKIKDKLTPTTPAAGATPGASPLSGAADEAKNSKNIVAKLFDGIKDIINSIKDIFRSLIKFVKDIGKDILKTISELIKGVGDVLQSVIKVIKNIGKDLFSALKEIIGGIGDVLNKGVEIVVNLANKLAGGAMKVLNTVMSGLAQASKSLPTILGNLGKAVGSFFSGLSTGLATFAQAMAAPTVLFGLPVGLIVVGMAMGLAKAAQISAPAIVALGLMFEGLAKVVTAMAPAIEAAGVAIKSILEGIGLVIESVGKSISIVITSIADSIVKLSSIDALNLYAVAGGITALGISLGAFGAGGLFAGLGSAIGKFFDEDPVEKLNRFASIEADKILKVADAITALKNAINNFGEATLKIGDTSNIENTINKLMEMYDKFEETPVEKVINQVATGANNLFEQASSWVSSLVTPSAETTGMMPATNVNSPSTASNINNNQSASTVNNNNASTLNVVNTNLVEEMKAVKAVLVQILNKDSSVYMDSTKVGTALNLGSVRI